MLRKRGIFYGWWVVLASLGTQFYFGGTFLNGFTAFFNPIVNDFGWSYAQVSLATTFRGFQNGFMAPVIGFLVDKYRPQKILIGAAVLAAIGFFVFSRIQSLWSFYVACILLGLSASGSSHVVVMSAAVAWFNKRRGIAMGVLSCGIAASGLLVPVLIFLIKSVGWRHSLELFAIGSIVISIPLALVIKDPKTNTDELPRVKVTQDSKATGQGLKPMDILKRKNFWLLSISLLFIGMATMAVWTHSIPYMVSVGLTRETAGWMVAVHSLSTIVGSLGFGWLGDVLDKRHCFMISALVLAIGLVIFTYARTIAQFFPALMMVGIGVGGINPLRPVLQLQFFGINSFATVQGLTLALVTIGGMVSPPFAGWVFDSFKNYQPVWLILAGFAVLTVPVILFSSKQEDFPKALPSENQAT